MRRDLLFGALAGAAGTAALNGVTYADMALRGRPSSDMPEKTVDLLTDRLGVSLGEEERAANRREGLGALFGYGVGLGVGAAYGLLAPRIHAGRAIAPFAVGLAAMVVSDAPAAALGLTDPRTWGAAGWMSDVVPHLAYGAVTVVTHRLLTDRDRRR
jgi:xanthosine utilization system XapX-like protein